MTTTTTTPECANFVWTLMMTFLYDSTSSAYNDFLFQVATESMEYSLHFGLDFFIYNLSIVYLTTIAL